ASALLANNLNANVLIISTAVDRAYLNYGQPNQRPIDRMTTSEARNFMAGGHFKAGSMLPKIGAAVQFLEEGNGDEVIICLPEQMLDAVNGRAGTHIVPDEMRLSDHY
ncbi:MAG: carbamate kinase, partial [Patescibacteria group bacterium]